ncbi:hypothetical protein L6452_43469 [Arctium lappa]|uniref:Uncharacterized protein n=1 Tax=Arctium lappa TaxID=4217 RepID=A0ACB8XE86_ARCLA|nr:hypothetical protein L6452_43469 [Arctium lappa]
MKKSATFHLENTERLGLSLIFKVTFVGFSHSIRQGTIDVIGITIFLHTFFLKSHCSPFSCTHLPGWFLPFLNLGFLDDLSFYYHRFCTNNNVYRCINRST